MLNKLIITFCCFLLVGCGSAIKTDPSKTQQLILTVDKRLLEPVEPLILLNKERKF